MRKIIDYYVIKISSETDLKHEVKAKINTGWQPYGSLQCVYDQGEKKVIYIQVMVKYKDE